MREKSLSTIELPDELKGKKGILAFPVYTIALHESSSSTVLCLQDDTRINDLKIIKNIHLHVKVGGVETSFGMIIYILFTLWDLSNESDKFTYEVLLNPNNYTSYSDYITLGSQNEWELLLVQGNEVLEIFRFTNTFNIVNGIKNALIYSSQCPCYNFFEAKREYFKKYSIEDLLS